jgi:hypothetical protein
MTVLDEAIEALFSEWDSKARTPAEAQLRKALGADSSDDPHAVALHMERRESYVAGARAALHHVRLSEQRILEHGSAVSCPFNHPLVEDHYACDDVWLCSLFGSFRFYCSTETQPKECPLRQGSVLVSAKGK